MMTVNLKILKNFKNFCSSSEINITTIYMKCRYSLSYREIEEISKMRELDVDHATIQRWMVKYLPLLEK